MKVKAEARMLGFKPTAASCHQKLGRDGGQILPQTPREKAMPLTPSLQNYWVTLSYPICGILLHQTQQMNTGVIT